MGVVGMSAISGPDYRIEEIELAGAALVADPAGVLYWPAERLLAVADLHFEKAYRWMRLALADSYRCRMIGRLPHMNSIGRVVLFAALIAEI